MSSHQHANVVAYRRMIEAFNRRDLAVVSRLASQALRYTIPGRSPIACETHTLEEHLAVLRRAAELSEGTLKLEPFAVAPDGDYLMIYGRITARRAGKTLDCPHAVMYRFEDGKIVEGRTIPTDLYAFDSFWTD